MNLLIVRSHYHHQLLLNVLRRKKKYGCTISNWYVLLKISITIITGYLKHHILRYPEGGDYNPAPEGYRKFLITSYASHKKNTNLTKSELAGKLIFLSDCYTKRYPGSLEEAVDRLELAYNEEL